MQHKIKLTQTGLFSSLYIAGILFSAALINKQAGEWMLAVHEHKGVLYEYEMCLRPKCIIKVLVYVVM